jgi:hypothetical protein
MQVVIDPWKPYAHSLSFSLARLLHYHWNFSCVCHYSYHIYHLPYSSLVGILVSGFIVVIYHVL